MKLSPLVYSVSPVPQVYPSLDGSQRVLPDGTFVTCSSDDTIRLWNLDPHMTTDTVYKRNIYSNVSMQDRAAVTRNNN